MDLKAGLQTHLAAGGQLLPLWDAAKVERFSALELAQAIEQQVNRAAASGLARIRIDMTHDDALALASYLRR